MPHRSVLLSTLVALVLILSTSVGFAFAQTPPSSGAGPKTSPAHLARIDPRPLHPGPGQHTVQRPDGSQALLATGTAQPENTPQSLESTGGPDEYGYTWNNAGAMNWIDATSGTATSLSNNISWHSEISDAVPLGFNFNFYGNTYSQVYISTAGAVGFDDFSLSGEYQLGTIPSPQSPNDVIAPYMGSFFVNAANYPGKIYYKKGVSGANHYIAVQWDRVKDSLGGTFTFEAVLYEDGTIDFNYKSMVHGSNSWWCGWGAAIENAAGEDGLSYRDPYYCNNMAGETGKAVRFTHPAPTARVGISDLSQGSLTVASAVKKFTVQVQNTGDRGADTYNLINSSAWTAALYEDDGTTLLADTDSDGNPDTGSLSSGGVATFVVAVQTPASVEVGDSGLVQLTVRSKLDPGKQKTVTLQLAVPSPFVQIYQDYSQEDAIGLDLFKTTAQAEKQLPGLLNDGYNSGILELPNGNLLVSRQYYHCLDDACDMEIMGIEYMLVDPTGKVVRPMTNLTGNSTSSNSYTTDTAPAMAVTPDGKIGLVWRRYTWDSQAQASNSNLFFAIMNASGALTYGPANITNNTAWFTNQNYLNVPSFYNQTIAATGDSRFVLGWERDHETGPNWEDYVENIYYSIRNSDGSLRADITKLTQDVGGGQDNFWKPVATSLVNNRVLLAWASNSAGIQYAVLTSAGTLNTPIKNVSGSGQARFGNPEDAAQLSNGSVIVSWNTSAGGMFSEVAYVVLNSSFGVVSGPKLLSPAAAKFGSVSSSIAADKNGRAILTWMDASYASNRHLYYALINADGNQQIGPQVMRTAVSTDWGYSSIQTNYSGQGNAGYSWEPAAASDVWANTLGLHMGPPAGAVPVQIQYGNMGLTTATSVVISATLGDGLTYLSDNLGVPAVVNGNLITWTISDQDFLEQGQFTLWLSLPDEAIGTIHSLDISIQSGGTDGNLTNNTVQAQVMAAKQLFLPLVID